MRGGGRRGLGAGHSGLGQNAWCTSGRRASGGCVGEGTARERLVVGESWESPWLLPLFTFNPGLIDPPPLTAPPGKHGHVNYATVPSICYTHPEVGTGEGKEDTTGALGLLACHFYRYFGRGLREALCGCKQDVVVATCWWLSRRASPCLH